MFLSRYLARCKLTNALAFFQWRCMTLVDTDFEYMIDANKGPKEMFYFRIECLIRNIEESLVKKKTLLEDLKANAKTKGRV